MRFLGKQVLQEEGAATPFPWEGSGGAPQGTESGKGEKAWCVAKVISAQVGAGVGSI